MKLKRIERDGVPHVLAQDGGGDWRDVTDVAGDLTGASLGAGALARLAEVNLSARPVVAGAHRLLPCIAGVGKFLGIGLNYSDHAEEMGMAHPEHPILFLKATSSIAGAEDDIVIPRGAACVDWEVELGVVIGQAAKYVSQADALRHVAGYCVVNDVSERTFQTALSGQWTKGKSCDSFGPLGPWFVTADAVPDPQDLELWLDVNGERRQAGNTGNMIFGVARIISHLSDLMTLHPGDVIATGTPAGVGMGRTPALYLQPGDRVGAGIAGLGTQNQKVRAD